MGESGKNPFTACHLCLDGGGVNPHEQIGTHTQDDGARTQMVWDSGTASGHDPIGIKEN